MIEVILVRSYLSRRSRGRATVRRFYGFQSAMKTKALSVCGPPKKMTIVSTQRGSAKFVGRSGLPFPTLDSVDLAALYLHLQLESETSKVYLEEGRVHWVSKHIRKTPKAARGHFALVKIDYLLLFKGSPFTLKKLLIENASQNKINQGRMLNTVFKALKPLFDGGVDQIPDDRAALLEAIAECKENYKLFAEVLTNYLIGVCPAIRRFLTRPPLNTNACLIAYRAELQWGELNKSEVQWPDKVISQRSPGIHTLVGQSPFFTPVFISVIDDGKLIVLHEKLQNMIIWIHIGDTLHEAEQPVIKRFPIRGASQDPTSSTKILTNDTQVVAINRLFLPDTMFSLEFFDLKQSDSPSTTSVMFPSNRKRLSLLEHKDCKFILFSRELFAVWVGYVQPTLLELGCKRLNMTRYDTSSPDRYHSTSTVWDCSSNGSSVTRSAVLHRFGGEIALFISHSTPEGVIVIEGCYPVGARNAARIRMEVTRRDEMEDENMLVMVTQHRNYIIKWVTPCKLIILRIPHLRHWKFLPTVLLSKARTVTATFDIGTWIYSVSKHNAVFVWKSQANMLGGSIVDIRMLKIS